MTGRICKSLLKINIFAYNFTHNWYFTEHLLETGVVTQVEDMSSLETSHDKKWLFPFSTGTDENE